MTESATSTRTHIGFASGLIGLAWSMTNPLYDQPYEFLAFALAGIGMLLFARELCDRSHNRFHWAARALAGTVFVGLWLLTMDELLTRLEILMQSLGGVSFPAAILLNLLGFDAIAEHGLLHVQHSDGLVSILPSFEKLGLHYSITVMTLWFMFHLFVGTSRLLQAATNALIAVAGVTVVRFALATAVYMEYDEILTSGSGTRAIAVLSGHIVSAISLCCLGMLLDTVIKRRPISLRFVVSESNSASFRCQAFVAAALVGTFLGFNLYCEPPGKPKSGRILIDDRFCGVWEPTARLLDQEWYGDFSTYSFGSLAEWLGHWFSVDVNTTTAYTDEYLSKYDVLIIKTPVIEIPANERESIDLFVKSGGGLLLVGDHTNLLGMGTHINALCAKHGIRFVYDAVSDAKTRGFVDCYGKKLGRPVGALHVEHLQFMTSCSLDLGFGAQPVVLGHSCKREPHDYAGNSFFGNSGPHPEMAHGNITLAAITRVGGGQIAAFTDSTVWSSFGVFQYDREKLAADLVSQLNRKPSRLRPVLRSIAIAILLATTTYMVRWKCVSNFTIWFGGLAGLWLGVFLTDQLHKVAYNLGPPNVPLSEVSFLWDGGSCAFPPVLGGTGSLPLDRAFDTLFVSVQRMGFVPRVAWKYQEILAEDTRVVFVIAPVNAPPAETLSALRRFVDNGGILVIMDDQRLEGKGSAGHYLHEFGADVQYTAASASSSSQVHSRLTAMEQLSDMPGPDVFIAQRVFGRGRVMYLREASQFSMIGMKHCFSRPSREVKQKYDTVFRILSLTPGWQEVDRRFYGIQPVDN